MVAWMVTILAVVKVAKMGYLMVALLVCKMVDLMDLTTVATTELYLEKSVAQEMAQISVA